MSSYYSYYDRYLAEEFDSHDGHDHGEDEEHSDASSSSTTFTASSDNSNNKPWGQVIGASLLIQVVTFAGLLLVGFFSCFRRLQRAGDKNNKSLWHVVHNQVIPSFASGALLATTVFLLIPEALALLEAGAGGDHDGHNHRLLRRFLEEGTNETSDFHDSHDGHDDHATNEDGATLVESSTEAAASAQYHEDDSGAAWKFGTALLGGFLFPILIAAIFPSPDVSNCKACQERAQADAANLSAAAAAAAIEEDTTNVMMMEAQDSQEEEENTPSSANNNEENFQDAVGVAENDPEEQTTLDLNCDEGNCPCHQDNDDDKVPIASGGKAGEKGSSSTTALKTTTGAHQEHNVALAISILIGDFFHNFADGVFIGTAFLLCSSALAWTITAATIYHELAQEIADYALLTHHCGLTNCQALSANFAVGFSVMFGALLVFGVDMSDTAIGAILSVSAGVYIYIAACECIPRIQAARRKARDTVIVVAFFILGAVPIGLVMLSHGHCGEH